MDDWTVFLEDISTFSSTRQMENSGMQPQSGWTPKRGVKVKQRSWPNPDPDQSSMAYLHQCLYRVAIKLSGKVFTTYSWHQTLHFYHLLTDNTYNARFRDGAAFPWVNGSCVCMFIHRGLLDLPSFFVTSPSCFIYLLFNHWSWSGFLMYVFAYLFGRIDICVYLPLFTRVFLYQYLSRCVV